MIEELLMMNDNRDEGRKKFLVILPMQDAEERVKFFNWMHLGERPKGADVSHGKKIEHLAYLLFSYKHQDLAQRNSHILSVTKTQQCQGGGADTAFVSAIYIEEYKFLMRGSTLFPVLDRQGADSGYYVGMEKVHNTFAGLDKWVRRHDGLEDMTRAFLPHPLLHASPPDASEPRRRSNTNTGLEHLRTVDIVEAMLLMSQKTNMPRR